MKLHTSSFSMMLKCILYMHLKLADNIMESLYKENTIGSIYVISTQKQKHKRELL